MCFLAAYVGQGPKAAPLRGTIGCIDANAATGAPLTVENQSVISVHTHSKGYTERDMSRVVRRQLGWFVAQVASIVFGPMEAGFSSRQFACLGEITIPGGIDTLTAENMVAAHCSSTVGQVNLYRAVKPLLSRSTTGEFDSPPTYIYGCRKSAQ
eukprot:1043582-Pyramimonas_sp.AAC.1